MAIPRYSSRASVPKTPPPPVYMNMSSPNHTYVVRSRSLKGPFSHNPTDVIKLWWQSRDKSYLFPAPPHFFLSCSLRKIKNQRRSQKTPLFGVPERSLKSRTLSILFMRWSNTLNRNCKNVIAVNIIGNSNTKILYFYMFTIFIKVILQ